MKRKHYHKDKDTLHPLVECGDVRYIYIYIKIEIEEGRKKKYICDMMRERKTEKRRNIKK